MTDLPNLPVDELVARVRALEDKEQILETLHRYGQALDYGLEEEFLDCFTEDAVWDVEPMTQAIRLEQERVGRLPAHHAGRDALRAFIRNHSSAPERLHKHFVADPLVTITGDSADVASYFLRIDANLGDTGAHIRASGRYLDRLVRCPDGHWRISSRLVETDAFVVQE